MEQSLLNCQGSYWDDKAFCGSNLTCQNDAVTDLDTCTCIAYGVGHEICGNFKLKSVIGLQPQSSGGPVSVTYNANHGGASAATYYLTVANGADNEVGVTAARIRVNGTYVFDTGELTASVAWADKTITLQPGDNSVVLDNDTTAFGRLSMFITPADINP